MIQDLALIDASIFYIQFHVISNICIFLFRIVLLEVDIAVLLEVDIAGHSCLRYAFCMVFHEIWIFLFRADFERCRIWKRVVRKL